MRKTLQILIIFCFCISFYGYAETLTVSLVSTTQAKIEEDNAPLSVEVEYNQNGGNGRGWLTQFAAADLTVKGIPQGVITGIRIYMHSNKKSGAGTLSLKLNDQSLLLLTGSFDKWQDVGYQSSFVPLSVDGVWEITSEDLIQLHILSSENSLYIQSLVIDYSPASPDIQCAVFRWTDGITRYEDTMCEDYAGDGIILPDLVGDDAYIWFEGEQYKFIGWTPYSTDNASANPFTVVPGHRYYLNQQPATLFALYKKQNIEPLITTDTIIDGHQYAMALRSMNDMYVFASGRVTDRKQPAIYQPLQRNEDGIIMWQTSAVPYEMRYRLNITDEGVTLCHLATNSYLGYNNSGSLSPYVRAWSWQKLANKTICIYHDMRDDHFARSVVVKEGENQDVYWVEAMAIWNESSEKLFLFDVTDLPYKAAPDCYTTFPAITPITETFVSDSCNCFKQLIDGHIVITCDKHTYNLSGTPLK